MVEGIHLDEVALSRSEIDVLLLEAMDKTPDAMAHALGISVSTVYGYRSRLMHKLEVRANPALRRWARRYYAELERRARTRGTP